MTFHEDERKLLNQLKSGKSIFRCIPDDIGDIVFCATSNQRKRPMSKRSRYLVLAFSILVPGLFIYLFHGTIWVIILSLLVAWMGIETALFFSGTDYFVGTKGFAIIEFKTKRSHIVKQQVVHWDEVEDVIATEMRKTDRNGDGKLDYYIRINGREMIGEKKRKELASFSDDYEDGKLNSVFNHEIRFWKAVEEQWLEYIWPVIQAKYDGGEELGFHQYLFDECDENYIRLQGRDIIVGKMAYRWADIQKTEADDEKITIYHKDYTTHLFGLVQDGITTEIYLKCIGNCQILKHIIEEHF